HGRVLLEVDRLVPAARGERVLDVRRQVVALLRRGGGRLLRLGHRGRRGGSDVRYVGGGGADRAGILVGQGLRARHALGCALIRRAALLAAAGARRSVAPGRALVAVAALGR